MLNGVLVALSILVGFSRAAATADAERAGETGQAFIGRHGLSFTIPQGYAARSRMDGPDEIIELYPRPDPAGDQPSEYGGDALLRPFRDEPEDWRVENFNRHGLTRLVISPRDARTRSGTVADRFKRRRVELERAGVVFQALEERSGGAHSFHIDASAPYCLREFLFQSRAHDYTLTSGCGGTGGALIREAIFAATAEERRPVPHANESADAGGPQPPPKDPSSWMRMPAKLPPSTLIALSVDLYTVLLFALHYVFSISNPTIIGPHFPSSLYLPFALFLVMLPDFQRGPGARYSYGRSVAVHTAAAISAGSVAGMILGLIAWSFVELGWSQRLIVLLIIGGMTAHMIRHARKAQDASWLDVLWRIALPAALVASLITWESATETIRPGHGLRDIATEAAILATVVCGMLGAAWGALAKRPVRPF